MVMPGEESVGRHTCCFRHVNRKHRHNFGRIVVLGKIGHTRMVIKDQLLTEPR